jgi:uncharacterized membrane protein
LRKRKRAKHLKSTNALPIQEKGKEKGMSKWKLLLGSRKFWAAFVGLVFLVIRNFDPGFDVPENETVAFVSILAAYILGVALEDGLRANS